MYIITISLIPTELNVPTCRMFKKEMKRLVTIAINLWLLLELPVRFKLLSHASSAKSIEIITWSTITGFNSNSFFNRYPKHQQSPQQSIYKNLLIKAPKSLRINSLTFGSARIESNFLLIAFLWPMAS